MQSSNPVFAKAPALSAPSVAHLEDILRTPRRLTLDDVVMKTAGLLSLVVITGTVAWVAKVGAGVLAIAAIGGLALALVNIFKKQVSPPLVIAYAAVQGVAVGALSRFYETAYSGIVVQAAVATTAIFAAVLWAYKSGRLRATPKFTKMVIGGFVGLFALLIVNFLASWIGGGDGLGLRSGGALSILFSLAFIVVGSLTFVLDFDQAEKMIDAGVDSKESWRIAFGLVVGLIWLYLEILRLLSYLNRR